MDAIVPVDTLNTDGKNLNDPQRSRSDSILQTTPLNETEMHSPDHIEPVNKKTHSTSSGFDVQRVYIAFVAALRESDNEKSPIGTQDYINGYRELVKFFDQLGYVFKFVKDDVVEKLNILQEFLDKNKQNSTHYDTIQGAIDYETANNLIKTKSHNFPRTLLRLHRALIFIEEFLRGLSERAPSDSTVSIATSAYDSTLYHHHPFYIRATVKVGFHALPSRKQLDEVLFHGHKTDMIEEYKIFMKTIKQIYNIIQAYYTEKNYLQLP